MAAKTEKSALKSKPDSTNLKKPEEEKKKKKTSWIPIIILLIIIIILLLQQFGCITLPKIFDNSGYYNIRPEATLGEKYAVNFTNELIPVLYNVYKVNNNTTPNNGPYTYYIGSGTLPAGLTLTADGILKGTPTGGSSTFEICIKDPMGISACRRYHLNVNDGDENPLNPNPTHCPTTACDSAGNCCGDSSPDAVTGSKTVTGILVPGDCECPPGTHWVLTDNTAAGGPWNLCDCGAA